MYHDSYRTKDIILCTIHNIYIYIIVGIIASDIYIYNLYIYIYISCIIRRPLPTAGGMRQRRGYKRWRKRWMKKTSRKSTSKKLEVRRSKQVARRKLVAKGRRSKQVARRKVVAKGSNYNQQDAEARGRTQKAHRNSDAKQREATAKERSWAKQKASRKSR